MIALTIPMLSAVCTCLPWDSCTKKILHLSEALRKHTVSSYVISNYQNILNVILKYSYCFFLKYFLFRISSIISFLQAGIWFGAGGPAGAEGSRCRKAGTEHVVAARSANREFWLCPLGKLCWGGSWSYLCSLCALHCKGGQEAATVETGRVSGKWSLTPSFATLVPVLIFNVAHQSSLSIGGWSDCCLR